MNVNATVNAERTFTFIPSMLGSPEYLRSRGPCRAPTSRSDDRPLQAQARRGRHDRPDDRCAPRARDIAALRSDPAETLVRFSPIEVARRAGRDDTRARLPAEARRRGRGKDKPRGGNEAPRVALATSGLDVHEVAVETL